jgi:hypothetical protein
MDAETRKAFETVFRKIDDLTETCIAIVVLQAKVENHFEDHKKLIASNRWFIMAVIAVGGLVCAVAGAVMGMLK